MDANSNVIKSKSNAKLVQSRFPLNSKYINELP